MSMNRTTIFLSALLFAASAIAAPKGMSETDEAVAKMQITEVLYRYALTHNVDDPEGYANLFTEDGEMGTIKGRAAILSMAKGEVVKLGKLGTTTEGAYKFGFMRSLIINPIVEVIDKTHARSVSYLASIVPNVDASNVPTIISMGTYQDDFRKVDGKWLIAKRQATSGLSNPALGAKLGLGPARKPE